MKFDWRKAPKWANWVAQDKNGAWHWYSKKPVKLSTHWFPEGFTECESFFKVENWEEQIYERPKGEK